VATVTLNFPDLTSGTAVALTIAMLRTELFRIVVEATRLTSPQPPLTTSQVTEGPSLGPLSRVALRQPHSQG
jgi:hypothetical protein